MKGAGKLFALILLCLTIPAACGKAPAELSPQEFIAGITEIAESGGVEALEGYKGKTCRFNARVDRIFPEGYADVLCTYGLRISLFLSPEELERIEAYDVLGLEGTVKEIETGRGRSIKIIMDPARVTDYTFQVTGRVERLFNNFNQNGEWTDENGRLLEDGQDVAMFLDDSVIKGRQMDVYLPEGHGLKEGDSITVRGKITSSEHYYGVTWIEDMPKQLVMLEPEFCP